MLNKIKKLVQNADVIAGCSLLETWLIVAVSFVLTCAIVVIGGYWTTVYLAGFVARHVTGVIAGIAVVAVIVIIDDSFFRHLQREWLKAHPNER